MPLELWIAFLLASAGLIALPGPTILLIVARALSEGMGAALAVIAGVLAGDLLTMALSLAGVGALIAASSELFLALKWAGAVYLVYLGLWQWCAPVEDLPVPEELAADSRGLARGLCQGFLVTVTNPKGLMFFIAFLPQFIAPTAPAGPQMVLLVASFLGLLLAIAGLYLLAARSLRPVLASPVARRLSQRLTGALLIAAGLATAGLRRL